MNSYASFALILAASAVLGAVAVRLRQPLLVAFIIVGIAAGPAGLNWVSSGHEIELLAQIGVTVLLFVVGLKLDFHVVRHIGPVALAAGLGQIVLTSGLGFLICAALGVSLVDAVYMAGALSLSSTIIIVKAAALKILRVVVSGFTRTPPTARPNTSPGWRSTSRRARTPNPLLTCVNTACAA